MVTDIYNEDVDFNFVKIQQLRHFCDNIQGFGNIQMYSTELEETSHKTMIKKGYRRSKTNYTSHEILRTYARLASFNIHERIYTWIYHVRWRMDYTTNTINNRLD